MYLITGALGLIGYEAVLFFLRKGYMVIGIDNNFRQNSLGVKTNFNIKLRYLKKHFPKLYFHYNYDLCEIRKIEEIFKTNDLSVIIHTAGQTSHDWATNNPFIDNEANMLTTLNLLELARRYAPTSTFIYTSTNKVYGDLVNTLPYCEKKMRFDLSDIHPLYHGIKETFSIDQSLHSLFGVSKLAADLYVQEYGRHFHMKTSCFRLGVVAGRGQNGAQQQGFLSYLFKNIIENNTIEIIGYQGKQVRDIIAASDVVSAFYAFINAPTFGAVYNLGGGRNNAFSLLELIQLMQKYSSKTIKTKFNKNVRSGDHKWWITDYSLFATHYPKWKVQKSVNSILAEMLDNSYD